MSSSTSGGHPAAQLPAMAPVLRRIADELQAVLRPALPSGERDRRLARAYLDVAAALATFTAACQRAATGQDGDP